jgi:hypothetical protein
MLLLSATTKGRGVKQTAGGDNANITVTKIKELLRDKIYCTCE